MNRSKIPLISRPQLPPNSSGQNPGSLKRRKRIPSFIWVLAANAPLLWVLFRSHEIDLVAKIISALIIAGIFTFILIAGTASKVGSPHSRFPTIIVIVGVPFLFPALIVVLFVFFGGDKQEIAKRPPPPSPSQPPEQAGVMPDFPTSPNSIWFYETEGMLPGRALSKLSLFTEADAPLSTVSEIRHEAKNFSFVTGTANVLNAGTLWLTARHVVSDCTRVGVGADKRDWTIATDIYVHPRADVALLKIPSLNGEREPLVFAKGYEKTQRAFAIGFPWGAPGGWSGMYMGTARARHTGQLTGYETVTVWSEVSRIPHKQLHMGGISGGAVLDASGHLIGIAIASHPRRGRHDVSTLLTINDFLRTAKQVSPISEDTSESPYNISDYNFPVFIKSFIRKNRIAKVMCFTS